MAHSSKPTGHLPVPLLIFGSVSLLLGLVAEVAGVFEGPTLALREAWEAGGLGLEVEAGLPGVSGFLVTAVASFGLVGAILGTPGVGRRLILGFSALLLTVGLIPACAVWGVFWNPFGVILAVIWSWFSAMVYAQTHEMPCEEGARWEAENVIRMDQDPVEEEESRNRSNGQS